MRTILRISSLAIAALVGTAAVVAGQPGVSVSVGQSFEGWSAADADSREYRAALAASIEQAFAGARGRVWASGDMLTYASGDDWTSLQVSSGATWAAPLSPDRATLYVGGSALMRRNGDAWASANVAAVSAFANVTLTPRATSSLRVGYGIDVRRFDDIASLGHVQHTASASGLINLPSRTTLIGEISVGTKRYNGGDDGSQGGAASTPIVIGGAGGFRTDVPGAAGNGTVDAGGAGGSGTGARAQVARPVITLAAQTADAVVASGPVTARQVTVFGRVAQSLSARTSIALDVSRRTTFGAVPPAVIATPAELLEDGLYDDPFASDATDARLTLTRIFANQAEVRLSGARLDKPFRMTPASGGDGYPRPDGALRHDRVTRIQVETRIPVAAAHTGAWDIALVLRGDHVSRASTDAFANYTSRGVTIGAAIGR